MSELVDQMPPFVEAFFTFFDDVDLLSSYGYLKNLHTLYVARKYVLLKHFSMMSLELIFIVWPLNLSIEGNFSISIDFLCNITT